MSMSTHVEGIAPPDEDWKKHKAVWEACEAAGVEIPEATRDFFQHEGPDPSGVVVELGRCDAVREWKDDSREGYEIELAKLPPHVKVVRVYNSW